MQNDSAAVKLNFPKHVPLKLLQMASPAPIVGDAATFLQDGLLRLSHTRHAFAYTYCQDTSTDSSHWAEVMSETIEKLSGWGNGVRIVVEVMSDACHYYLIVFTECTPATSEVQAIQQTCTGALALSPLNLREFQTLAQHFPDDCTLHSQTLEDAQGQRISAMTVTDSAEGVETGVMSGLVTHLAGRTERSFLILDFQPAKSGLLKYGVHFVLASADAHAEQAVMDDVQQISVSIGASTSKIAGQRARRLVQELSPFGGRIQARHTAYVDNVADLVPT